MSVTADAGPAPATPQPAARRHGTLRRWLVFILLGLVLYLALYVIAEVLVQTNGQKNRFFMIHNAPSQPAYDFVVLGASHAMPFGFDDTNEKLEEATGARIINLSIEGAGVLPNRFVMDYFLQRHSAKNVVYILDSFAFDSAQWNEERLNDAGLFKRAPLDLDLALTMWRYPWMRGMLPEYLSGFAKINNEDRFAPDLPDSEINKFDRTYRSVAQIDRQRIAYLYPPDVPPETTDRYMAEFEAFIGFLKEHGIGMIAVKPPMPQRVRDKLPGEPAYDVRMQALLARNGVPYYDYSHVNNDDPFFYDTDHLNRTGVTALNEAYLVPMLKEYVGKEASAPPDAPVLVIPQPPPAEEPAEAPAEPAPAAAPAPAAPAP